MEQASDRCKDVGGGQSTWPKRSWSTYNGNCVEVMWRKSSWSSYNGNCVEVATIGGRLIGVRGTKDAGSWPVFVFTGTAWWSFMPVVNHG